MTDADHMRAYRVLTGKTGNLIVSASVIGRLWADGGETTRAILSAALDSRVLDACHTVATKGIQPGRGTGKVQHYGSRPTRPRQDDEEEVSMFVLRLLLDGKPIPRKPNRAEVRAATLNLTRKGHSPASIARRVGVTERHVYRILERDRQAKQREENALRCEITVKPRKPTTGDK